jgi:hypothetical protein
MAEVKGTREGTDLLVKDTNKLEKPRPTYAIRPTAE